MSATTLEGVYSALGLAEGDRKQVAVLPIGTFDTGKYGELEITPSMATEIVTNWTNRVLKTDIRFDIGHDMTEAAGWIVGLSIGTFPHPVSGADMPGILADVEWTPVGQKLLGEKQYRYVSSYLSSYKDEETGTVYSNVLMAVALCNDPVMRMLPPVELAEAPASGETHVIELGEVVDEMTKTDRREESHEALWDAFGAAQTILRREIEENGLAGEALVARVAELTTDLPNAVKVSIDAETEDKTGDAATELAPALADTGEKDPVAEWLARFDSLMADADAIVGGTSGVRTARTLASEARKKLAALLTKKGGTTQMSDTDIKLDGELSPEAIELAELKQSIRTAKVETALDALSAKGMTEPARKMLGAILTSEPDAIVLSEGAEAVDQADALLAFAEAVEFVPVETETGETELENTAGKVTLSEDEKLTAKQMGVSEDAMLAAKIAREADTKDEE